MAGAESLRRARSFPNRDEFVTADLAVCERNDRHIANCIDFVVERLDLSRQPCVQLLNLSRQPRIERLNLSRQPSVQFLNLSCQFTIQVGDV